MQKQKPGLIILAGGYSVRMGYPKAFFETGGRSFTELIAIAYSGIVDEMIIVLNEAFCGPKWLQSLARLPEKMRYVINNEPERDRIHTLHLGAREIQANNVFVHNVDQPFISHHVIREMAETNMTGDILIPTYKYHCGHPVLLNRNVLNDLRGNDMTGVNLKDFYARYRKQFLEVKDDSIFHNINSTQNLESALRQQ